MEREGAAVTCDGRLFHRRAAVTGNALSPTVSKRVRRTSRDVDEAERSRRLVWVSAGRRSSSHWYVGARPFWHCTPKQRPYNWFARRPSASEVGWAAGWCVFGGIFFRGGLSERENGSTFTRNGPCAVCEIFFFHLLVSEHLAAGLWGCGMMRLWRQTAGWDAAADYNVGRLIA